MTKTILIGVAGLMGTVLRYWLSEFVAQKHGKTFPWGTMTVNLIGCFVAGAVFSAIEDRLLVSSTMRAAIFIGLLGGFTTFSAYGLETFTLLRDGRLGWAAVNIAGSNLLGLLMVWTGYSLARTL